MNKLIKYFKRVDGQSLAEFAVTTAMMATLATTAAPKFSGVGEGAKEKKTLSDIDKILKSANNFYNEQVTKSGRGRFPGQAKYNSPVPTGGGYAYTGDNDQTDAELNVKTDLVGVDGNNDGDYNDTEDTAPSFTSFNNTAEAGLWASVFGTDNADAEMPNGSSISTVEDPADAYWTNNTITPGLGAEEFLNALVGTRLKVLSRMVTIYTQ